MWVAFLLPSERRKSSPSTSVGDFERRMELLAQAEAHGSAGRWIITPRKGVRFVGATERKKVRARERRRQVFTFLLEAITISFLIGLVPPLRVVWSITAVFGVLLLLYVWLLISLKARAGAHANERVAAARAPERTPRRLDERHVAQGAGNWARPTLNGLGLVGEGDTVHVVVRPADQMGVAGY
jgi:hypothetical protein